jgi:hypothetical protein
VGIKGLPEVLRPWLTSVQVSKYKGLRAAVDAYSWLHKAGPGRHLLAMSISALRTLGPVLPLLLHLLLLLLLLLLLSHSLHLLLLVLIRSCILLRHSIRLLLLLLLLLPLLLLLILPGS